MASLMSLCLLLTLLPAAALASGIDEEEIRAGTYLELEAALESETVRRIIILPYQQNEYGENTEEPFLWPEDDYTLNLEAASPNTSIQLGNGTWTIPEHVTVNAYDSVHLGSPTGMGVVIGGTWNCMNNTATLGNVGDGSSYYGSVTVNGTLGIANKVPCWPVKAGSFTVNGTVKNAGTFYAGDLTLGDGAVIRDIKDPTLYNSERDVRISGTVTCEGSAVIEGRLIPSTGNANDSSLVLDGDFALKHIAMSVEASSLTITKNSHVTVERLSVSGGTVNLNGTMEILPSLTSSSYAFDGTSSASPVLNMGGDSVLKIGAGLRLDNQDSTGTVSGSGTIELYATLMDYGSYTRWYDHATLFGLYKTADGTPAQVGEGVTIWRCWEDCEHGEWGAAATLEPTCGTQGYDYSFCDACGAEKRGNLKDPTNDHDYSVTDSYEEGLELYCSKCGHGAYLGIYASEMTYTGSPVEGAELVGEGLAWLDYTPTISYTDNVEIGTATATAVVEGVTISCTFEIVGGCAHTGGTATCEELAICDLCKEPYGEYGDHVPLYEANCQELAFCGVCGEEYGELTDHDWKLTSDARAHWYECSVCQEPATDEETAAAMMDDGLLGLWERLCAEHGVTYSYNTHIYKTDGTCYLCDYSDSGEDDHSGTGWSIKNGLLTVVGSIGTDGAMPEYGYGSAPWSEYGNEITAIVVESGVSAISEGAFAGLESVTSVTLPEGLVSIGSAAFESCDISAITLPASLTELGGWALNCGGLTDVAVASGSESFKSENGVLFTKDGTTLVLYPQGRTAEHYDIPDGTTIIGDDSFLNSGWLRTVDLTGVKKVGNSAFYGCGSLTVTLPETMESIGYNAFGDLQNTTITVPASAKFVDELAFNGPNMTAILVDSGNPNYCSVDGVLFTKDKKTLQEYPVARSATAYAIPDGTETIADQAFWLLNECAFLKELTVPASVTAMSLSATWDNKLERVIFLGDAPEDLNPGRAFRRVAENFTICYAAGTDGWTDSEFYDAAKGTWGGFPLEQMASGGIRVTSEYDSSLCTFTVYNFEGYNEGNYQIIPNGGYLPLVEDANYGRAVMEITDIAEGYRIKDFLINGESYADMMIDGAYGGGSTNFKTDTHLVVILEEIPDPLATIRSVEIRTHQNPHESSVAVENVTFSEDGIFGLHAAIMFADGETYPDYFASCDWEYSMDGVNWKLVPAWGTRTDFNAAWYGFTDPEWVNPTMDFMTMKNYFLRVKVFDREDYSTIDGGAAFIYSAPVSVNASPLTPTVNTKTRTVDLDITLNELPETLAPEQEVSLIAALYDGSRLLGVERKTVTVGEGSTIRESLELTYGRSYAPDRCKVFLLDDESAAPLMAAPEQPLT